MTNRQTMNEDVNLTSTEQLHLKQVSQKIEEFEKRMNYKAQTLSQEDQERLDTKFYNSLRLRRWVE